MRAELLLFSARRLLFGYKKDALRRLLQREVAALGVDVHFVLHSLRHGGATHMFTIDEESLDSIVVRGRWKRMESGRHYVQEGRFDLIRMALPRAVEAEAAAAVAA